MLTALSKAGQLSGEKALPADLVAQLKQENYFTLLLPSDLGGQQMELPEYISLVQSIGQLDASCAWCVNQGSVLSTLARLLAPDLARHIWVSPDITLANGPPIQAHSKAIDNGFSLSGTWSFSSGINHADWLLGMAPVTETGETRRYLWHFFPKSEARIVDDWDVSGLSATGSFQFSVDDLMIETGFAVSVGTRPEDPPLYQIPMNLLFACGFAGVALGTARSALDLSLQKLGQKIKRFDRKVMSNDVLNQDQVGRAEATWQAADDYLRSQVSSVWGSVNNSGVCSLDDKIKLRLAATHCIRQAKRVTDDAYDLCSTDSIFETEDIHKKFQDMHVITQHVQGRPEVYALVGKHYLGLPVESPLLN